MFGLLKFIGLLEVGTDGAEMERTSSRTMLVGDTEVLVPEHAVLCTRTCEFLDHHVFRPE